MLKLLGKELKGRMANGMAYLYGRSEGKKATDAEIAKIRAAAIAKLRDIK
jgi:hypothetical protein